MSPCKRTQRAKALALGAGFDAAGVMRADSLPDLQIKLQTFLDAGRHGGMQWMETRSAERADPQTLWPEAKSILLVGQNYGPKEDPLHLLQKKSKGAISVYARGRDYHDVVKKKLKALGGALASEFDCALKVFVDTAPVMEKPLAAAAGLGWQGKHTNLVSRDFGSWLFLGAIFLPIELEADAPHDDHCGECRRCLDICPTNAFPAPYQLDARRCISYLTIEHSGPIPLEFRRAIGNRIYGCDDCLTVCPWNKFAKHTREIALTAKDAFVEPDLMKLASLDDAEFRAMFSKNPVKRSGRERFVRNVLIAIGNSENPRLAEAAKHLLADHSPLVRGAAVWALSELMPSSEFAMLVKEHGGRERDPGVLKEWRLGDG
ncbi:MAG: tRNA epoxyqueuosine(34) reductase QueG [Parvularculaceae bacterium]